MAFAPSRVRARRESLPPPARPDLDDRALRGGVATLRGPRAHNEDRSILAPELGLAAIADGMGGQAGGAIAAQLATHTLRRAFARLRAFGLVPSAAFVEDSVRAAEAAVRAERHDAYAAMATTIALAVVHGSIALVAHVGDSRVYRVRDGVAARLTRDHTLVEAMRDLGLTGPDLTAFEASQGHLITRGLGLDDARPDVRAIALASGDRLVLTTDGVHDVLGDREIALVVATQPDPTEAAAALVASAAAAGSGDNATAVVLHVQ